MKPFSIFLNETTTRSHYPHPPAKAAVLYNTAITNDGHTIKSVSVKDNGDHEIIHHTPNGKVRVSTLHADFYSSDEPQTRVINRPATEEEQVQHGPKK